VSGTVSHPALLRTLVRFGLLVALLLGVGAMHTLGHQHEDAHAAVHAAHGTDSYEAHGHAAAGPQASADSADGIPRLDPTTMCLAIGAVVVALFGAAAALCRLPGPFVGPAPRRGSTLLRRSVCPRDPPTRADLQVYVI
jgi:hypothetical protein